MGMVDPTKVKRYDDSMKKSLTLAAVLLSASIMLSGCGILSERPQPIDPGVTSPTESPTPGNTVEPSTSPSNAPISEGIVVLTPDEVVPIDAFVRSTPAGSWPVGAGLPNGFPSGVPAFNNRWIKNNFIEYTDGTTGNTAYSVMFWGDYNDLDALVKAFSASGYRIDTDEIIEQRRLIVVESPTRKVVITATESAKNPGEDELIDPAYSYALILLDNKP